MLIAYIYIAQDNLKWSIRGWPHALWAKPIKSSLFTFIPTKLVPIEQVNVTLSRRYIMLKFHRVQNSSECLQLDILS